MAPPSQPPLTATELVLDVYGSGVGVSMVTGSGGVISGIVVVVDVVVVEVVLVVVVVVVGGTVVVVVVVAPTVNGEETTLVRPELEAVISFVPIKSTFRLVKVATPATALTVVVPESVPVPALKVTVTALVALLIRLQLMSPILKIGCWLKATPATPLAGSVATHTLATEPARKVTESPVLSTGQTMATALLSAITVTKLQVEVPVASERLQGDWVFPVPETENCGVTPATGFPAESNSSIVIFEVAIPSARMEVVAVIVLVAESTLAAIPLALGAAFLAPQAVRLSIARHARKLAAI